MPVVPPTPSRRAPQAAPYDLLIGADGTQSAVRSAMMAADKAMAVEIADSGRE